MLYIYIYRYIVISSLAIVDFIVVLFWCQITYPSVYVSANSRSGVYRRNHLSVKLRNYSRNFRNRT